MITGFKLLAIKTNFNERTKEEERIAKEQAKKTQRQYISQEERITMRRIYRNYRGIKQYTSAYDQDFRAVIENLITNHSKEITYYTIDNLCTKYIDREENVQKEAEDQKTKIQKESEDIISQIYQDKQRELE